MAEHDLREKLLGIVEELIAKGPGYAQESVVLREAAERLQITGNLQREQALLTCWHNLFREGILSWGYDVDNPSAPFFHKSEKVEI